MIRFRRVAILAAAALLLVGGLAFSIAREAAPMNVSRADAQKMYADRNYKDAYEAFRRLALDPATDSGQVGGDLKIALTCLQQLNRASEIDPFRERVIAVHAGNWRLLHAAAQSYMDLDHFGFMIAGKFERGRHRGGGQVVNSAERDRVRAVQLMVQAMPLAARDNQRAAVSQFFFELGQMLLNNRGFAEAWRLQALTDLETLPDYEQGWGYGGSATAAPVEADGNPVYHKTPKSFEAAQNDGERWRWSLEQAIEIDPSRRNEVRHHFAQFLRSQFGVETLASSGIPFGRMAVDDTKQEESGTYALHTLGENETIARLATGVKRFSLPDEFNFLKIFQEIAADPRQPYAQQACVELAQIFENRRQYPRAAEAWQRCLREHPGNRPGWQQRLDQIVKNWGRFEPVATQGAGSGATVDYRFRNGREVKFTAKEIDVAMLLDDVKAYIKSRPNQLDHRKLDIGNIGHRLVSENEQKYVTKVAATWTTPLEPRANHFDRRITVTTPLATPGAYLLTAEIRDGNQCHIVLWVADTAIVKKPLDRKVWFFVGDAVTGKPIPKANVEFFGFRQEQRQPRRFDLLTKQFAEYTDADGQLALDQRAVPDGYQWIVIARAAPRRFAFLGYTHIWFGQHYDEEYNQTRVYTITDRPVYRPGQKVHYKAWLRHAKYDMPDASEFAGRGVAIEIYDAKNDRVINQSVTLDPYGGVEGELDLPADASLGVWRLNIVDMGGGTFRVEEYKKPEFEVTVDAPAEPVMLGERIEAEIKAKYYFGAPVTQAKVKYKVMRSAADKPWYPARPWDWFYGPGYWWFAYDYRWYPGFAEWGCLRPMPFWWPRAAGPPEIVAQREVEIGPDGTLKVEIDTLPAKEIHPDKDHEYTITAEVVDQSRRTIVGTGSVLVARQPFKVYAWIDRGYYRVGDTIDAHFSARTLDSRPVEAAGEAQLLAIRYRDGKPVETPVFTSPISTDAQGMADLKLKAAAPGQYRLACQLTDKKEHTIEGGYIFTVRGETASGEDFRYNAIELVPEKAEYRPGEKVQLMVNTDRLDGTVLLFIRPANGVYLPPRVVRL
ncbi:MAG: MG2 domain-containing protein, partial [Planctomycetota bacterium]|nr:MG2 domain-containing protein [Planctomycetota bacterium]